MGVSRELEEKVLAVFRFGKDGIHHGWEVKQW
jgi:hypothetical protein